MPDDARVVLKGQWVWSPEVEAAIFVLDPDSGFVVLETQGNGQLAIIPDDGDGPSHHVHEECYQTAVGEEEEELYGLDGPDFCKDDLWDDRAIDEIRHNLRNMKDVR